MHYKTIVLELIQDRPEFYEKLRSSKRLLPTMDAYAIELKASHEAWKQEIARRHPGVDPSQMTAEAMELAIRSIQDRLPCESTADDEPPSLDAAMIHIRRHTPPA